MKTILDKEKCDMRKIALIVGCLLYCLSPIDLLPDFIPGVGQLDDLAAIVLTIRSLVSKKEGNSTV
jgi:uncharacterized membrane protein YkvA (DUF1232 family)